MASLIPALGACASRMTSSERRLAERLEQKLDDDDLLWYDVPIGPKQTHPDFVLLHPRRGLLILETKDWKLETILRANRQAWDILANGQAKVVINPLTQVTIRHLTGGSLSQVLLPLPGVEERTEIVHRVEAPCTAARAQAQRLTPLVLAKASRGELVPQDPTDEPASELLVCIGLAKTAAAKQVKEAPIGREQGARKKATA